MTALSLDVGSAASDRERERAYQAAYFQRKNADPEWRAKRLAKIRAYKLRKKLESAQ